MKKKVKNTIIYRKEGAMYKQKKKRKELKHALLWKPKKKRKYLFSMKSNKAVEFGSLSLLLMLFRRSNERGERGFLYNYRFCLCWKMFLLCSRFS